MNYFEIYSAIVMPFILVFIAAEYSKNIKQLSLHALKNLINIWLLGFALFFLIEYLVFTNDFFESIKISIGLSIIGLVASVSFYYIRIRG